MPFVMQWRYFQVVIPLSRAQYHFHSTWTASSWKGRATSQRKYPIAITIILYYLKYIYSRSLCFIVHYHHKSSCAYRFMKDQATSWEWRKSAPADVLRPISKPIMLVVSTSHFTLILVLSILRDAHPVDKLVTAYLGSSLTSTPRAVWKVSVGRNISFSANSIIYLTIHSMHMVLKESCDWLNGQ